MTKVTTLTDPVGLQEIADRLEVPRGTVNSWRSRSKTERRVAGLPEPDAIRTGTPLWSWATIKAWAFETGRLDANGRPF